MEAAPLAPDPAVSPTLPFLRGCWPNNEEDEAAAPPSSALDTAAAAAAATPAASLEIDDVTCDLTMACAPCTSPALPMTVDHTATMALDRASTCQGRESGQSS